MCRPCAPRSSGWPTTTGSRRTGARRWSRRGWWIARCGTCAAETIRFSLDEAIKGDEAYRLDIGKGVADARARLGKAAQIGVTCHDSRHLGMEAAEAGADYVAFGAFFPTDTKVTTHRPEPEMRQPRARVMLGLPPRAKERFVDHVDGPWRFESGEYDDLARFVRKFKR